MDRISGLKASEILKELQTYTLYKGKTQKQIKEELGSSVYNLRDELRRLKKLENQPTVKKVKRKSPSPRKIPIVKTSKRPEFKPINIDIDYDILPDIRCKCGKPTSLYAQSYQEQRAQGITPFDLFNQYNIKRECCRSTLAQPPRVSSYKSPYVYQTYNVEQGLSNLSINPLLNTKKEEVVRVIEGNKPLVLKKKITDEQGQFIRYEDITSSDFPTRQIPGRDLFISYK